MTARVLDGRIIAASVRADLESIAAAYQQAHGRSATLAILAIGHDPASGIYTNSLRRAALSLGMEARHIELAEDITDVDLRHAIQNLNADSDVQGILVEFPLPSHLSQQVVAEAIDQRKDVDGIGIRNLGALFLRLPSFVPATCAAVLEMLDRSEIELTGKRVVVVGASNVVGKPLAFLLLHRDATVTVCHIDTRDLTHWTRQADVLVVAVGRPGLITAAMVKPGAVGRGCGHQRARGWRDQRRRRLRRGGGGGWRDHPGARRCRSAHQPDAAAPDVARGRPARST